MQLSDHFLNNVITHSTASNWHFFTTFLCSSFHYRNKKIAKAFSHSLADKGLNLLGCNRTDKT